VMRPFNAGELNFHDVFLIVFRADAMRLICLFTRIVNHLALWNGFASRANFFRHRPMCF